MTLKANTNKIKVIVGASEGLGKALTLKYAEAGFSVIAIARNKKALEALHAEHPNNITPVVADITSAQDRTKIAEAIKDDIDIVFNAAVTMPAQLVDIDESDFTTALTTNLFTPIFLTKVLQNNLNHSRVLFISSGLAHYPLPGLGAYCISKAGLHMAWQIFKEEVTNEKAIFGTLLPGVIDTKMQQGLRTQNLQQLPSLSTFKTFSDEAMLRKPEEVAKFIFHVMEETSEHDFLSQEWNVDA